MERPEPYLAGPWRRHLAPWFFSLLIAAVMLDVFVERAGFLSGPVLLTFGLTVGARAIDALRTGRLLGWSPGNVAEHADRDHEPVRFWFLTIYFLMLGLVLTLLCGWSLMRAV
jgi:hypothetical protein